MSRLLCIACALPIAATLACNDASSRQPPVTTAAGGAGGATSAGGAGGGAPTCNDDPSMAPPGAVCIAQVRGTIVDEQQQGLEGLLVSVCGSLDCTPGTTEPSGDFVVEVAAHINPADYSTLAHARELNKAGFYFQVPIDATGPIVDVGPLIQLQMPTTGPSLIVDTDMMGAPAQSETSNGVTIDIDAGVSVNLGSDDAFLGAVGKQYRAQLVPAALHDAYIDPALNVQLLYAFYPFESRFRLESDLTQLRPVRLSFPNATTGWAPGTNVEFLALGSYIFANWVKPAAFEVVATGTVSSDGMRIETTPGEGFTYLTWVGVRETL